MTGIDLRAGAVRIRPLRLDELELLTAAPDDGAAPLSFNRPPEEVLRRMRRKIERSGRFVEGRLDLAIEVDGRLVGTIEARQPREGLPPGAYEIGISLFEPPDRGRGLGTAAVEAFTAFLFAEPATQRVQASTWVENAAMRRVLEKVGFSFEGVMRGFMPTPEGGRDDYALYAVTRADWQSREN